MAEIGRDADLGKLTCRSTRILNSNNRQKKHTVDAISHDLFVEHFEKLGNIPEEELLHAFDNETDIFVHDDLENDISADEVLKCIKKLKNNKSCGYDGNS